MSDGAEPAFDARLEALARSLAVSVNVSAILSIRAEITALIEECSKAGSDPVMSHEGHEPSLRSINGASPDASVSY